MNSTTLELAEDYLKSKTTHMPQTAIVLGSGLGDFAQNMEDKTEIPYRDIPGFPTSTAPGHASKLIFGKIDGNPLILFQGRFHLYEGYDLKNITFPYELLAHMGCKNLILTNAAGGINRTFNPGDLMVITDHINFTFQNPLKGAKFNDMSGAYSAKLISLLVRASKESDVPVKKGTYAWTTGPSFESAAEIQMMRILGAHAVGMSTVPEVIAAVHEKMEVAAISCISNMACGILDQPITSEEVIETGKAVGVRFSKLIRNLVKLISEESS